MTSKDGAPDHDRPRGADGAAVRASLLHGTRAEQGTAGEGWRAATPRRRLGELGADAGRDPIGILRAQNADRVPDLVPIRRERMSESPFAFYRGAAAVMAADLAATPSTGLWVQLAGDAHLANFGLFASRDRELVFDVNDFDETAPGPWEWDLKRLAASLVVCARDNGLDAAAGRAAATAVSAAYRAELDELAVLPATDRFFTRVRAKDVLRTIEASHDASATRLAKQGVRKAKGNTSARALGSLTAERSDGGLRIVDQPPLTTRLPGEVEPAQSIADDYLRSVPQDVAHLLDCFEFQDGVVKVVGVGSVGTRCYLALFTDPDGGPLFLQFKEATASVLEAHTAPSTAATPGERVVVGQRIMQASGDPFLGHIGEPDGRSYYVRQYRDMKGGIEPHKLTTAADLAGYGRLCGVALGRAHAQSGVPAAIAGYLGSGKGGTVADDAVADFAEAYADRNEADYRLLLQASDADWYQPPA